MSKPFKLAADCVPCPDGCGEPWCSDCQMHYADCDCPGPFSEEANVSETLVVVSKVKALGKAKELRTSEGAIVELSKLVEEKLNAAAEKAKAANRKTIMAEDFA
jgi:hypothetical protein